MELNITQQFYDELTDDYHLIFENRHDSIIKQWQTLHNIIQQYWKITTKTIFDCSCGIWTQTLWLAQLWYQILWSDLSKNAIERAKQESIKLWLNIDFMVCDFRDIDSKITESFDAIISCDNSLPHLLDKKDLARTLSNIHLKLNNNWIFIGSIRDYDQTIQTKPISTQPNVLYHNWLKTISFQVRDRENDNVYTTNHFTIKCIWNQYETKVRKAQYRAYQRSEFTSLFTTIWFKDIKWLMPEESWYYQPIIIAFK